MVNRRTPQKGEQCASWPAAELNRVNAAGLRTA